MRRYLNIGGLVAVGFDTSGEYMLTISHSGRGVFSTKTWNKIDRYSEAAYPENGIAVGIGPIGGELIFVKEVDTETGRLKMVTPDGRFSLEYEDGMIEINELIDGI